MNYERKHLILTMIIFAILIGPAIYLIATNFAGIWNIVISMCAGVILMMLSIFITNRIIKE